jgi:hypothetical protein
MSHLQQMPGRQWSHPRPSAGRQYSGLGCCRAATPNSLASLYSAAPAPGSEQGDEAPEGRSQSPMQAHKSGLVPLIVLPEGRQAPGNTFSISPMVRFPPSLHYYVRATPILLECACLHSLLQNERQIEREGRLIGRNADLCLDVLFPLGVSCPSSLLSVWFCVHLACVAGQLGSVQLAWQHVMLLVSQLSALQFGGIARDWKRIHQPLGQNKTSIAQCACIP